jgi:hypothetical protein
MGLLSFRRGDFPGTGGATLPIAIQPRFTETRLFAISAVAAIVVISLAVYRLRVRRLYARARELEAGVAEALSNVRVLRGLFPICASCKKIRDDQGYWSQIESYVRDHSEAEFSHSICPDCMKRLYPGYAKAVADRSATGPGPGA